MKKATVIGHFAFGFEYFDGQTVKTKIVTESLCNYFGEENVGKVDTHGGIKTLIKAPVQIFKALKNSENVIILPAHNGLRVYAPLLRIMKPFFKNRKIHYAVIGGWLPKFTKKYRYLRNSLYSFDGIYAETNIMKNALEAQQFENIYVMPNCKQLDILSGEELIFSRSAPYKFCTFSRVMREKGIEDAANAIIKINGEYGYTACTFDIYGPVDPGQTEWFEELQKKFPPYIRYCGCVAPDKSVEVLKNYFALLFPTRFYTEGIPGTIIDAYSAGVPVISSKWESFSDVVDDGVTGIGYEFDNTEAFEKELRLAVQSPACLNDMKANCTEAAKKYSPEKAIDVLIKNMS